MTTTKEVAKGALATRLSEIDRLHREKVAAEEAYKTAAKELIDEGFSTALLPGEVEDVTITAVHPAEEVVDLDVLKAGVSAYRFRQLTVRKINRSAWDAARKAGKIPADVIRRAVTIKPKASYLSITRSKKS